MARPRQGDLRHVASGGDPYAEERASRAERNVARVDVEKTASP
jgi:hypothetical protein